MAIKKFTKNAQRVLNHNPNVVSCTEGKISFTEEFALKVCDAMKKGEDPYQVFIDNGFSIRILGKSRINGVLGLWRSKYGLENLPRRQTVKKEPKVVETAQQKRQKNLGNAILAVEELIKDPVALGLPSDVDTMTLHFAAIQKVYEESKVRVIVKDLIAYYGYSYTKYYAYLQSKKPKEEFVNILNPHQRRK